MLNLHTKRDFSWLIKQGSISTSSVSTSAFTVEYNGNDSNFANFTLRDGNSLAEWANQGLAEAALLTALTPRRARTGRDYGVKARDALLESILIVVDNS